MRSRSLAICIYDGLSYNRNKDFAMQSGVGVAIEH